VPKDLKADALANRIGLLNFEPVARFAQDLRHRR
jgi:hypothetical protein